MKRIKMIVPILVLALAMVSCTTQGDPKVEEINKVDVTETNEGDDQSVADDKKDDTPKSGEEDEKDTASEDDQVSGETETPEIPEIPEEPAIQLPITKFVATDALNVRAEATKESDIIGVLEMGHQVSVIEIADLGEGDIWYKFVLVERVEAVEGVEAVAAVEAVEAVAADDTNEAIEAVEAVEAVEGVEAVAGVEEILGWISEKHMSNVKLDIRKPYAEVDYTAFEKNTDFPDNPPVKVKGVYLTGYSTSNQKLEEVIEMIKTTELNAVVIDVKDDGGTLLFKSEAAEKYLPSANDRVYLKNPEEVLKRLKEENIYTIARIVTFKSPRYAKANPDKSIVYKGTNTPYGNRDGTAWASPYNRDLWYYNVGVAKEAIALGFNEIQFDYVRFPATGSKVDVNLDFKNELGESKALAIQNFLIYAYGEINALDTYVSADLFGWAATSIGDVGIGQHWEALTNVVDYTCPMVYPSHYGPNNFGLAVPDAQPYETIKYSMMDAMARNENVETPSLLRPWIQDFTAKWVPGYIVYNTPQVKAQIQALKDLGIEEYLVWNAANRYHYDAFEKIEE